MKTCLDCTHFLPGATLDDIDQCTLAPVWQVIARPAGHWCGTHAAAPAPTLPEAARRNAKKTAKSPKRKESKK